MAVLDWLGSLRVALHLFMQFFSMLAALASRGWFPWCVVVLDWLAPSLHICHSDGLAGLAEAFSLLPVVGFFLLFGWFPHVLHVIGWCSLPIGPPAASLFCLVSPFTLEFVCRWLAAGSIGLELS